MAKKKGKGGKGRQPTPQPPAPQQGQGGYYQYQPTAESQINQPYQDYMAAGSLGALSDVINRQPQQNQMADIYGQGAAGNLGGAQQGMDQLAGLGGQAGGLSQGSMGQYGQLMDPNFQVQQNMANRLLAAQGGARDFDPFLNQQFAEDERQLREQLRRNLGRDYEQSSAGIEALARFNQKRDITLGSAQFNQLQALNAMQQGGLGNLQGAGLGYGGFQQGAQGQQFGQGAQLGGMYGNQTGQLFDQSQAMRQNQLAGAGSMLNMTGQMQQLYGNIPQTMGQFGQAMSGQSGAAVNAQQPFQHDRDQQFAQSFTPGPTQFAGQMMGQSGNRWIQAANSMGGGGGGGGGMGMSGSTNQWGGGAGTGAGDPYYQQRWAQAGG